MNYDVTTKVGDAPATTNTITSTAFPHVLRVIASGFPNTTPVVQSMQAMLWAEVLMETGELTITTSNGTTFHIKRQYETEVPDHVEVHGDLGEAGCNNPQLLDACLRRIKRYEHLKKVNLFLSPRIPADAPPHKHPGWCEYLMVLTFESGCRLTVGVIQRQPGANIEFHS